MFLCKSDKSLILTKCVKLKQNAANQLPTSCKLEGDAKFKLIFISNVFNFKNVGAYHAAFMLNFLKHPIFQFLKDFRGGMAISNKDHCFLDTL